MCYFVIFFPFSFLFFILDFHTYIFFTIIFLDMLGPISLSVSVEHNARHPCASESFRTTERQTFMQKPRHLNVVCTDKNKLNKENRHICHVRLSHSEFTLRIWSLFAFLPTSQSRSRIQNNTNMYYFSIASPPPPSPSP